jgi:hypothetical protein
MIIKFAKSHLVSPNFIIAIASSGHKCETRDSFRQKSQAEENSGILEARFLWRRRPAGGFSRSLQSKSAGKTPTLQNGLSKLAFAGPFSA